MKFFIQNRNLENQKNSCIILAIFKNKKLPYTTKMFDKISAGYIQKTIQQDALEGNIGETLLLYHVPNIKTTKILLIGCGNEKKICTYQYKNILHTSIMALNKTGTTNAIFYLTTLYIKNKNFYWKIKQAIEIFQESLYTFNQLKKKTKKTKEKIQQITFYAPTNTNLIQGKKAIQHGLIISQGIKIARDLGNLPSNICTPKYLLKKSYQIIHKQQSTKKITIQTIDKKQMQKLGMNAYLSVSQSSYNPPIIILIKYYGKNKNTFSTPTIFIGKGITFDTGGLCIKPSVSMYDMKYDMCGASTVLGLMHIITKLNLPLNILGILATSENVIDNKSCHPGDIISTLSGKTVEILNTDAEGRLILSDVLSYVEKFNPQAVIDIATLTGACVIALGHHYTGLISNNKTLANKLKKAAKQTTDKIWQLPLGKEYKKQLESKFADIKNIGENAGGAITAGYFLSYFAKKYPWAHLDIAGTAYNNVGATGKPISMLSQFLLNTSYKNYK
ncbi:MAG: aminopeptidase A/I [Candidatus Westeberhardia cardiocondylae]|nr:aminopeptidase A/I [Candidatus Westeberhardia cardiocondylae]